jgi:DNA-binding NtrC family response regulator
VGRRILVVDDEEQILGMLRTMLEREGYEIETARDGKEAARSYRARPADLILTDLIMPEQEGLGLILELRREFPDVRVVVMSGGGKVSAEEYLPIARKLGAVEALQKPFSRSELIRAIRSALSEPGPDP